MIERKFSDEIESELDSMQTNAGIRKQEFSEPIEIEEYE
jgi:hypothetical protein